MNVHILRAIGRSLDRVYQETVEQPVPPQFLDVLGRFEAREASRRTASPQLRVVGTALDLAGGMLPRERRPRDFAAHTAGQLQP